MRIQRTEVRNRSFSHFPAFYFISRKSSSSPLYCMNQNLSTTCAPRRNELPPAASTAPIPPGLLFQDRRQMPVRSQQRASKVVGYLG